MTEEQKNTLKQAIRVADMEDTDIDFFVEDLIAKINCEVEKWPEKKQEEYRLALDKLREEAEGFIVECAEMDDDEMDEVITFLGCMLFIGIFHLIVD